MPQLLDRDLELLDQQRPRAWASASAAKRAARSARTIVFRVMISSGRESSALIEQRESQHAVSV
jgi:hypothetical protein